MIYLIPILIPTNYLGSFSSQFEHIMPTIITVRVEAPNGSYVEIIRNEMNMLEIFKERY